MPLSPKQQRIYDFIRRYLESNKEAPTIAEIGRQFQMRSPASVHKVLGVLEDAGKITKVPNVSRGIRLVELTEVQSK
jgi:repressor LexA